MVAALWLGSYRALPGRKPSLREKNRKERRWKRLLGLSCWALRTSFNSPRRRWWEKGLARADEGGTRANGG